MTNLGSFALAKKGPHRAGCVSTPIMRVTPDELPLSCPMPGHPVTSLHPKVYLPIKSLGMVVCPYCSTRYQLSE